MRRLLPAILFLLLTSGAVRAQDEERAWAFTPVHRPAVPTVQDTHWLANPVDAFILKGLEDLDLSPSPRASRRTLVRRLHLDLVGIPPTPEQVDRFLADTRPDAWTRLVDRLLASPAYGQKWAQHWLDVVRYADSDGFEYDDPRPHAWRYRDWVIESLNHDKPFARFVGEQIAADELFPEDARALPALGLHRLGPLRMNAGNQDVAKNRQERLTEIIDVVGSAFLGVTFGCARCHDHKFDPLSQADYYRLQAFFAASRAVDLPLVAAKERSRREAARKSWMARRDEIRKTLEAIEAPARKRLTEQRRRGFSPQTLAALAIDPAIRTPGQSRLASAAERLLVIGEADIRESLAKGERREYVLVQARLQAVQSAEPPAVASVMAIVDRGRKVPVTHRLVRGDPHDLGEEVFPSFPSVMVDAGGTVRPTSFRQRPRPSIDEVSESDGGQSPGRRAELAAWLASASNPLTARLFVNRVWQHHFGQGIVATPNDFGVMGAAATHPELLDWLATELVSTHGRIKPLHRLMVLSATYQQSSSLANGATAATAAGLDADPDNQMLWRARRHRLEAEALRDSLLAVSGRLNLQSGGPGVRLPLPPEVAALQYKGTWQAHPDLFQHNRRSIYLFVKRNNRPPLLTDFDAPGTMVSCGRRNQSSHAGQALTLLNSPELARQSQAFASRLENEAGRAPVAVVERAYRLALGRGPSPDELSLGRAFLENGEGSFAETLSDYCLVLFNLDEFLYVE